MKARALLVSALGVCACACAGVNLHAGLPGTVIYQRATHEFAAACFFKPAEEKTNDLAFTLAPLILQEVTGTNESLPRPDWFGTLSFSNGVPSLGLSRPAIYWQVDAVQFNGKAHARFTYVWCYAAAVRGSERGPGTASHSMKLGNNQQPTSNLEHPTTGMRAGIGCWRLDVGGWMFCSAGSEFQSANTGIGRIVSPAPPESGLAVQGIRMTLNTNGQPVIWEALADSSGAELIFVSQTLEAAALAEHGKPLPGRRHAIERSTEAAPNVIVARVIDDGPVAMGPIVYLNAGTRNVSTLICRCMPAQARKLLATSTYDLLPLQPMTLQFLQARAGALAKPHTAFWPSDQRTDDRLEHWLRLPSAF
jgi:hypothetical protein